MLSSDAIEKISADRLGVLGGTFDPVHNGHLAIASCALDVLRLDYLLFIPAARPPHKGHCETIPLLHRLAMLEVAVRSQPRFLVSDMEAHRPGLSYSIDTLIDLNNFLNYKVQLFFILGMDAFLELNTWKKYQELTDQANIVVVDRPGYPLRMLKGEVKQLGDFTFDLEGDCWNDPEHKGRIYSLAVPPVDISSTKIRAKIAEGKEVGRFVPPSVSRYIKQQSLYRQPGVEGRTSNGKAG